jgi:LacI family transcriptional regulator
VVAKAARKPLTGRRAVTLRDVAAAAGTTPMTVSNVLNNRRGAVSEALAEHVRQVSLALGYRPHATARRLRTQRHQAVGVVLVDPSPYYLSDPMTASILAGLTAALSKQSYGTMLLGVAPSQVYEASFLREIETDGVCLILSGPADKRRAVMEKIQAIDQPLVVIQEELPDHIADGASVYQDDRRGAMALAEHLMQSNPKQVAMLVPQVEWPAMVRREAGVREVVGNGTKLHVLRTANEGYEATQAALADHIRKHGVPDALIAGNDQMAIAGMKHLQGMGLKIPSDVKVAGFNGLEFWRYSEPELTTVFSSAFALGEKAGETMLGRLTSGSFPFRELVLPVRLGIHASTT